MYFWLRNTKISIFMANRGSTHFTYTCTIHTLATHYACISDWETQKLTSVWPNQGHKHFYIHMHNTYTSYTLRIYFWLRNTKVNILMAQPVFFKTFIWSCFSEFELILINSCSRWPEYSKIKIQWKNVAKLNLLEACIVEFCTESKLELNLLINLSAETICGEKGCGQIEFEGGFQDGKLAWLLLGAPAQNLIFLIYS